MTGAPLFVCKIEIRMFGRDDYLIVPFSSQPVVFL